MTLSALGIFSAAGAGGLGAYELISTTILGTAQGTVDFTGLGAYSGSYKHLQIRYSARATTAAINFRVRINGDTGSNYAWHFLNGSVSAASSGGASNQAFIALGVVATTANQFSPGTIDFLDTYSTTKNKTVRSIGAAESGSTLWAQLSSGFRNVTDSVTSISVIAGASDTFTSGSRFSIYGIKG
jgi:hypothetical protein